MRNVSAGFLEALRAPSSRVCVRVTTTGGTVLRVTGGSVTMDSRRSIARSCELRLAPTADLALDDVMSLLSSPATEVKVERGLYVDGVPEYVPLGVFATETAQIAGVDSREVMMTGVDRSKKIARARRTEPYSIAAGATLAAAGAAMLADRWGAVETDFSGLEEALSVGIAYEDGATSDPWAEASKLFADFGYYLYFDGDGVARARIVPDPTTADSVFSFGSGETSRVISSSRVARLDTVYNGVRVRGTGADVETPVQAVVWDDDPMSPTYYLGAFGMAPYFYESPLLTTEAACALAARTIFAKFRGKASQLSWASVVNPALEQLDPVAIDFRGQVAVHVIDRLTVPLLARDAMPADARSTGVVEDE